MAQESGLPRTVLCRFADLADGQARGFDPAGLGRDTMFIVRRGDRLHAWRNACPHIDGAPMAWRKDAYLDAHGGHIVCAAHGALFDIATGVCTLGPSLGKALAPVAVQVLPAQDGTPELVVIAQAGAPAAA